MEKGLQLVSVLSAESYTRQNGTVGYRCTGLTEEGKAVVFYRDSSDGVPKAKDKYQMYIAFDRSCNAVVRFQRFDG